MSEKLIRNLQELSESIRKNSAYMEKALSSQGSKPNRAIVASAAKYRKALELLAKE